MGGILSIQNQTNTNCNNNIYKSTTIISEMEEELRYEGSSGYYLNGNFVPEDVLIIILSHVEPKQLLNCKLVCKSWNRLVKSHTLWNEIYVRHYGKQAKHLPWYMFYIKFTTSFFDSNHIKNGNGQEKFDHWVIKPIFSGDGFVIENEPMGSQPLPQDVNEFNGHLSCFATSFGLCSKQQIFRFKDKPSYKYILDKYKPTIVASEWYAPRFDCSCMYRLIVRVVQSNKKFKDYPITRTEQQWTEGVWQKVEIVIDDYPDDISYIVFQHEGQDLLFWKGHYGCKMAGASLEFSFDSIKDARIENSEN